MKLHFLLFTTLLIGCSSPQKPEKLQMSADNPFNVSLNEPFDYAKVTGDHIESYVDAMIHNANIDFEKLKSTDKISFESTFGAYDEISNSLGKAYSNAHMMYWVSTDSITRAKGLEGSQKIDSLFTDISSDRAIYNKFQEYVASEEGKTIDGPKKMLIERTLEEFTQSGVNLNPKDLATFKKLSLEIKELSAKFTTNMNTAQESLVLNEQEVDGLSENFKDTYRLEDGSYKIPVINATSSQIMNNATSSNVRKAYVVKKNNIAADQNLPILDSLISKRYQLAKIMGYKSYAEYNLQSKMVKTPQRVWNFLDNLVVESKSKALQEMDLLKTVRNQDRNTPDDKSSINPWDMGYYINQHLKIKYDVDYEKMRDYLPMDACLEGMMVMYQELLGLEFKKVQNPSVWHEDVTMYEVYENDQLKGRFYLDLYPRPNKETWFYAVPLTSGRTFTNGQEVPVAMLLGNFNKPTENLPSLLSFGELNTLFHEFGHIVDCMSYNGDYSSLAYPKADFVEAMSQIFENWVDDYDIISAFAKHYETGDAFPKTLFESKLHAKNVFSGLSAQGTIRYALYDMNLYDSYNPKDPLNTDKLWQDLDAKMGTLNGYIEGTHPQASWIHINTHPVYTYGYLWSEVYAQDMFTAFKQNGLRDTETGMKYRQLILANGGQRDMVSAVEEFLGRPSNNKAYIESLGLK